MCEYVRACVSMYLRVCECVCPRCSNNGGHSQRCKKHVRVYFEVCVCWCVYVYMYVCMYVFGCVCVHVGAYMRGCSCVCLCAMGEVGRAHNATVEEVEHELCV